MARPVIRAVDSVTINTRLFPIKVLHLYQKNEVLEMTVRLQLVCVPFAYDFVNDFFIDIFFNLELAR